MEYRLLIDGQWVTTGDWIEVKNKYSGASLGAVAAAGRGQVDAAREGAGRGAAAREEMPAHRRAAILGRAAELIRERAEDLAQTLAAEAGKALKFARAEVDRSGWTFQTASEEARRLHGETIPLDGLPAGEGYFGFYTRRPVGVIAAISPLHFPPHPVARKGGPALAAGNSVVLKPATTTPITAVKLCEILIEAGL